MVVSPEETFEACYREHYWAVSRFVARRLGDQPEEVRDVVAEVFATAWRRRRIVPPEVLPWLYGVARHVVGNEQRRRGRQRRLARRLSLHRHEDGAEPVALLDAVDAAMASLSEADREVLRLAAWEDLTTEELSVTLHCSRSAAAMRLSRARARLRDRLTESRAPIASDDTSHPRWSPSTRGTA